MSASELRQSLFGKKCVSPVLKVLCVKRVRPNDQGCQIFFVQHTKMVENIPNFHKIYQNIYKVYQGAAKKTLQKLSKFGFFV
jgi:hypothetical protein